MVQRFYRGLNKAFIDALNEEYLESTSWWQKLLCDDTLYIGIRKNYLNVYFNGCSILELHHSKTKGFYGKTHFKYLINLSRQNKNSDYVEFRCGEFDEVVLERPYSHIFADLEGIKDSTRNYQGEEKTGVHYIAVRNLNVIDVEIQFPSTGKRIDFAALKRIGGEIRIVFFEAKCYSNKELNSPLEQPKVVDQVNSYQEVLMEKEDEIICTYRQVAENISNMTGWRERRSNIFIEAAKGNLVVDKDVKLAIFGYDRLQKKDAEREGGIFAHLCELLGEERVLVTGNPREFTSGIRFRE